MATHFLADHSAVVHRFEPRRVPSSSTNAGEARGQVIRFPGPAASARRSRLSALESRPRAPEPAPTSAAHLVETVVQANLRAMQTVFPIGRPAELLDLQQRAAREYMAVVTETNAAVLRAMTRLFSASWAPGAWMVQPGSAHTQAPLNIGPYRTAAE